MPPDSAKPPLRVGLRYWVAFFTGPGAQHVSGVGWSPRNLSRSGRSASIRSPWTSATSRRCDWPTDTPADARAGQHMAELDIAKLRAAAADPRQGAVVAQAGAWRSCRNRLDRSTAQAARAVLTLSCATSSTGSGSALSSASSGSRCCTEIGSSAKNRMSAPSGATRAQTSCPGCNG